METYQESLRDYREKKVSEAMAETIEVLLDTRFAAIYIPRAVTGMKTLGTVKLVRCGVEKRGALLRDNDSGSYYLYGSTYDQAILNRKLVEDAIGRAK